MHAMLPTACACTKLRRSARIVSAFYDDALAGEGITVAQFALLRTLIRIGPASLTRFGEATGHDRTTLNRTLGSLEKAGWVRSGAGDDKRARIVAITDAGREAVRRAEPAWLAAQSEIEARLGTDLPALYQLLDRVEALRA